MKKVVIISVALFVGYFAYLGLMSDKSVDGNKKTIVNDIKVNSPTEVEQNVNSSQEPTEIDENTIIEIQPQDLAAMKISANEKKVEIERLMLEFDQHKSDKSKREEIQKKINRVMAEYNKLILPVALDQVKNNK